MNVLTLKAQKFRPEIGDELSRRNLISFIAHPEEGIRSSLKNSFYKGADFSAARHGFHSVTISYTEIMLSSHPEGQDEIVFLWDNAKDAKPLYFVFALDKRPTYCAKLKSGNLTTEDYVAVCFPYNDPRFSSFVIWHDTVHCELTDGGSDRMLYPSFFVLEPQSLIVSYTEEKKKGVELALERQL